MNEWGEGVKVIVFIWAPLLIIGISLLAWVDKHEKECKKNRQAVKREERRKYVA